ncbi:hypothetical protein [Blastomonas sp. AAP53]|nr:hypothetical protein [Blastomonas sp. AAP53]
MTQWTYVILSYALGISGTIGLIGYCWVALRRAEARLDALKRK